MLCRTCGVSLPEGRIADFCPQCSFGGAFGLETLNAGQAESVEGYELLHELGRGGMGVVWLARERSLDRLVALKLIAVADPVLGQRLLREGRAAAQLRHPNIVSVHALGGTGSSAFLAMDFIEGGDLGSDLKGKPLSPRVSAEIASKLAGALAHAHAAGLLHRDVKPSNILMDLDGEPRLADFGLAAPLEGGGDLTNPGSVAGTPAYLAPELLGGSERTLPESDIYGLGAVLYTCLTGRPPFIGPPAEILAQLPDRDPLAPHLLQPGVPRDLETICLKCMEKVPGRRYPSAASLKADLDAFLSGEPISARPVGPMERAVRYCRRRPALALSTGLAAALLLTLAIGGPLMAVRLARSQRAAVAAQGRAERAEAATLERLRDSLLARSRATRLAGLRGQRDEALAAATEAAQIRGGLDARDEVIAALARPEIVQVREFQIRPVVGGMVAFDPNRDRYAVETGKGQLELRRLSDDTMIQSLRGTPSKLWSTPVFSPDGRWIAARNENGEEIIWSDKRPDLAFVLKDRPYVLTGRFSGYGCPEAFSPDGLILASALPSGGVSFHSTGDGTELRRIPTDAMVTHLGFSSDGRWLAVGRGLRGKHGEVASLRVLNALDGAEVARLPIEASYQTIAWSPGNNRLMTGAEEFRIFGIPGGESLNRVSDPLALLAFFGPGGSTVLSSGDSGVTTLWDLGRSRPLLVADLGASPMIGVNSEGTLIAKAGGGDTARLYRLEMSKVTWALPVRSSIQRDSVQSTATSVIDYSPDGRWLATAVWGAVQMRDASGAIVAVAPQGLSTNRCTVHFSRDGQSLLAASTDLGLVRIPVLVSGNGAPSLGESITIDPEPGFSIADVSHDGTLAVLTAVRKGLCKVVRLEGPPTGPRWSLPGAAGAAFVDDGRDVLANSVDDSKGALIELRDAASGQLRRTLDYPHGGHIHASAD
ncbi:MAG TPA: WD40 repeat domain-containing serine/threonine protein kinase, partial [Dongiaceae bacterium]|nr:WD40 repeat domain-containing serine/threonine protein kinase [Dongiaceae bacterium]